MERQKRQGAEYEFYGKLPLKKAIPLGLQHVLAMFVGNLTPILIISGACGIAGEEFGSLQVDLLQNAMPSYCRSSLRQYLPFYFSGNP